MSASKAFLKNVETEMSLEQYQVRRSSFDKFYDLFLHNFMKGVAYKIVLTDGSSAVGVPTAGSVVNPFDPNVSFSFRSDGKVYRIPFSVLADVVSASEE